MEKYFERIVYTYSDSLYRICMHYVKNTADAQDIVQQTFVKLIEKNINFESREHEKAWLIRVCINLCKDHLKSSWHSRVFSIQDQEFTSPEYNIPDQYPLLNYIRTLPPNQRTAIYLFYYEDMPVNEICTVMGAKQNTVLSWLRRGRKALKKMIKEEL
ncbi:MAG: sigma-70 family RNA polymerase sigma factor [Oscillospiraceae bacterium]|nr:sigma-70 family RNA polymerase sigma factor [Oscillospiraceae bacterium]